MSINKAIYKKLKEIAHKKQTIFYGKIAPRARLDMKIPKDRKILGAILDEINQEEREQGRPLLSAVVVRKDTKIPGVGFFKSAQALGLFIGTDTKKFHSKELKKVYKHWLAINL